ncbi:MAG: DUF4440 domain-containing protein [Gemmatimonadales bacterium]|nr:DUF4440 domain-containing protein [Gemmatimonadales bacterium]NIN11764.1 DUF4440 domain-containing protein [Gemmatimonadales bacterium]NIN50320.1 DUF4440 domain-containing protein [Gemmatimonadales bacterium]NIP07784.1 DUF4440 domain-containing protein [Gemmatimonadales bacterium]NIQ99216.1 DUF4440 domain-containing protein [Gemmatimonadales bacterium]
MSRGWAIVLTQVLLLLIGCRQADRQPAVVLEADIAAIVEVREALEGTHNDGDVEAFLVHCTDGMVTIRPGAPAIVGRDQMRRALQLHLEFDRPTETFRSGEIAVAGEWAFDTGTSVEAIRLPGRPAVEIHYNYVMIFQRQPDSSWKVARHIWNRSS